ncbi:MAG TPA: DUF4013 domain-containing protein [Anaerolineales bacterium]|nr:DUF4013 domain-containing protein [Anaerolineales bacterium]
MNNLQEILLFPVRDAEARKQFLFACLITLTGFIVPLIPMFILMGYIAKIMRQIIEERKKPSMPDWQTSDYSDMFMDGLRVHGAQLIYYLPFMFIIVVGILSMMSGTIAASVSINENGQSFAPVALPFIFIGMGIMMVLFVLLIPYSVIVSAVAPHVATTRSFTSAFQVTGWWAVFRKAAGQFILSYVIVMAVSWVLTFIMQFAMLTIILICIVPLIMIPYTAYITLVSNVLYAQAYSTGIDNLTLEQHASA